MKRTHCLEGAKRAQEETKCTVRRAKRAPRANNLRSDLFRLQSLVCASLEWAKQAGDPCLTLWLAGSSVQPNTGRTARDLNKGDYYGEASLGAGLLARLDLHGPCFDLSDAYCSENDSAFPGCSRRRRHFLLEFLSRCRAVFLDGDCQLVPNCKVLG